MALNFLLGRAGSGKTWTCVAAARRAMVEAPDGPPLVLLVPEQATHQTERALLIDAGGPRAAVRARVLSFRRLAALVLAETGGTALPLLDPAGRGMLLAAIGADLAEEFEVFGAAARRTGFAARLGATLNELAAQGADEATLRDATARLSSGGDDQNVGDPDEDGPTTGFAGREALAAKLRDLTKVVAAYRDALGGAYLDPHDPQDLAADRLASSGLLAGATVWVDGFAGFTPQEMELLAAIGREAAEVWVALCLDPAAVKGRVGRGANRYAAGGLFRPTLETYYQLKALAADHQIPVGQTVTLASSEGRRARFAAGGPLGYLERYWTMEPGPAAAPVAAGESIKLVAAPDPRREVAAAAAELLRLARDHGWAWRDMAVVVPDLERYHDLIETTFADYGIPWFIDRRGPVPHHPLVEFVRSAVEVARGNWPPESVFRWLKTDLTGVARDEVDLLENYVLAHGIRGSSWTDPGQWTYWETPLVPGAAGEAGPDGGERFLARINACRRAVTDRLGPAVAALRDATTQPRPATELVRAIWNLVAGAGVGDRLREWAEAARGAGDGAAAQAHEGVWLGLGRILTGLYAALGQRLLSLEAFEGVLRAGLEGLTLGLVPPSLDQVVCSTIERGRQAKLKAMFLLGAAQDGFPAVPAEDLVFDDRERGALAQAGLDLAATARDRALNQEYLTYIALTRAADYLWVSWPGGTAAGAAASPAPLVARLERLFADLRRRTPDELELCWRPGQVVTATMAQLSRLGAGLTLDDRWRAAYNWLAARGPDTGADTRAWSGLTWDNQAPAIGPELATRLFGEPISGSASRLEAFEACPFAHFAAYGLRLAPRPLQQVRAPELGSFFHAVLQLFSHGLRDAGVDLGDLAPAEIDARLWGTIDQLAPRLEGSVLLSDARHRYLIRILGRTLRRTLSWLAQHAKRGAYRQRHAELGFGLPGASLPALPIGGVNLRGVIDRIDVAEDPVDGRRLLRVIDYKSGRPGLDLPDVAAGLSLQLLVYYAVALEHLPELAGGEAAEVTGLLLLPVQDPLVPVTGPNAPGRTKAVARRWRAAGLVLDEPTALGLMDGPGGRGEAEPLLPVRVSRSGKASGQALVSRERFRLLAAFLRSRVSRTGRRLRRGEVSIKPWRRGAGRACTYCLYHAVCHFDPRLPSNLYRELPGGGAKRAWADIRAQVDAADDPAKADGRDDRGGGGP